MLADPANAASRKGGGPGMGLLMDLNCMAGIARHAVRRYSSLAPESFTMRSTTGAMSS